jgi:hypothetical protein
MRQNILERHFEGDVQRDPDRSRTERPEAEHAFAAPADPEERGAALWHLEREREADHVAVERHRPA